MVAPNPSNRQEEDTRCIVTVIVPTCNRIELLEICLRRLECQTFRSFRIVIVNNGAAGPASVARLPSRKVMWIHLPRNEGTAAAFNRGLAECRESPYVFLLNDDAEVEPGCLALLVKALEKTPSCSVAVPKLLQWSNPSRLDGAGDEILLSGGAFRVGQGQLDEGQYDRIETVLSACGAAALYRRSLFDDVGDFDEDYFAYGEDVDLGLRALLRGHRCLFVPEARVRHRGSATIGSPFHPKIIRLTTRNQILTIIKDYPLPVLLRLLPRIMVFQILWMGLAMKKHAFLASCMGLMGAIRMLPRTLRKRRHAMSHRVVCNRELLRLLTESERRIWRWHSSFRDGRPSKMLAAYFWIFGQPDA
jgi:GT2 family glycosyltransferase